MIKVVYNACYGGFDLSDEAKKELAFLKQVAVEDLNIRWGWEDNYIPRHDPDLIAVVERLGAHAASGSYANLQIEVIEGDRYYINDYDGNESVETPETIDWVVVNE